MELKYTVYNRNELGIEKEVTAIYKPTASELLEEIGFLIYNNYFGNVYKKKNIKDIDIVMSIIKFIFDFNLLDILALTYKDELKGIFEQRAWDQYFDTYFETIQKPSNTENLKQ